MLKELMNSPVAWLVLAIISVVSLVFAIYEHFKNKKFKELTHYDTNFTVIDNGEKSLSKIAVMYDGKEVDNVAVSKFAIWNSGTETIERENLVPEHNIKMRAKNGAKILDARIIGTTDKTNEFSIKLNSETEVTIDFKYADSKDGCVVQIVHTGKKSDISVECKVIGGKKFKKGRLEELFYGKELLLYNFKIPYTYILKFFVFLVFFTDASIVMRWTEITNRLFNFSKFNFIATIVDIILINITVVMIILLLRKGAKIPRKLRPYLKDISKYYNEDED